jgi:hypothetical protein
MDFDIDKYYSIIKKCGFDDIESFEMYVFFERFLTDDVQIYELALNYEDIDKEINEIIKKHKDEYNEYLTKNESFWLCGDGYKLQSLVAKYLDFNTLNEYILKNQPKWCRRLDFLRGYLYTYSYEDNKLEQKCDWDNVYNDTISVIKETKGRAYCFLRILVDLYYKNPKPDSFYGFTFEELLKKTVEYTGSTKTIAPRDWTILKAYRIYFKTGGKKYPEHAIPIECVPAIDKALEDYKNKNIKRV